MKEKFVVSRIIHSGHSSNSQIATLNTSGRVLHRSMVRTKSITKIKHFNLDELIAVGKVNDHNHVEIFTLASSKWQTKKDYPYSEDIYRYSILAAEKKFIIFGGGSYKRRVLTNHKISKSVVLRPESFRLTGEPKPGYCVMKFLPIEGFDVIIKRFDVLT